MSECYERRIDTSAYHAYLAYMHSTVTQLDGVVIVVALGFVVLLVAQAVCDIRYQLLTTKRNRIGS